MNPTFPISAALRACLAAVALSIALPLFAAPGAHGPDGEHLDAPTSTIGHSVLPYMETSSDLFELVAELKNGQLQIHIDRYASNEPVVDATVEVESGALKAAATYQTVEGHYLLESSELLETLGEADEHPLMFTILAGEEADLLNGILDTRRADAPLDQAHSHALEWAAWGAGGLLVAGLLAVVVRRRQPRATQGGPQ